MVTALIRKKMQQFYLARFIRAGKSSAADREYIKTGGNGRGGSGFGRNSWPRRAPRKTGSIRRCFIRRPPSSAIFYLLQKAAEDDIHADKEMLIYLAFSPRNGRRLW